MLWGNYFLLLDCTRSRWGHYLFVMTVLLIMKDFGASYANCMWYLTSPFVQTLLNAIPVGNIVCNLDAYYQF